MATTMTDARDRRRARRLVREQPACQHCGEVGYLGHDDDTDAYAICDVCGHEQH